MVSLIYAILSESPPKIIFPSVAWVAVEIWEEAGGVTLQIGTKLDPFSAVNWDHFMYLRHVGPSRDPNKRSIKGSKNKFYV